MRSVWNEWHGIDEFSPECNPACVPGGVKQIEASSKGKWRGCWSSADQKLFSRIKYLVGYTESLITSSTLESVALDLMDDYFNQKSQFRLWRNFLNPSAKNKQKP